MAINLGYWLFPVVVKEACPWRSEVELVLPHFLSQKSIANTFPPGPGRELKGLLATYRPYLERCVQDNIACIAVGLAQYRCEGSETMLAKVEMSQ